MRLPWVGAQTLWKHFSGAKLLRFHKSFAMKVLGPENVGTRREEPPVGNQLKTGGRD